MCIDEGQDLALNEYRLLYELNQYRVVFNIYGDTNQLIKPGRGMTRFLNSDKNHLKYNRLNKKEKSNANRGIFIFLRGRFFGSRF